MKTIQLKEGTVTLYEDIKRELTIDRFNEFQNYIMQDIGIGNDMASIDKHFFKLDEFIKTESYADALRERQNLHYNFYAAFNKINFKQLSFACMIHSVNGEPVKDYSESTLMEVLVTLDKMGLTQSDVEESLEAVKKKLIAT